MFIVKCLFDYNCTKAVEICLFMRNMQLSFASEAYTELVIRLIQQVVVDCPEKGKKAIIEMIKKQKSFNSELCAEI